jgi:hypothetical protein
MICQLQSVLGIVLVECELVETNLLIEEVFLYPLGSVDLKPPAAVRQQVNPELSEVGTPGTTGQELVAKRGAEILAVGSRILKFGKLHKVAPVLVLIPRVAMRRSGDGEKDFLGAVNRVFAAAFAFVLLGVGLAALRDFGAASEAKSGILDRGHCALDGLDEAFRGDRGVNVREVIAAQLRARRSWRGH